MAQAHALGKPAADVVVPRLRLCPSNRPPNGFSNTQSVIDQLRAAAEALNRGDPEPFVSLFAQDAEWRGIPRGHLWWKRTPS